MGRQVGPVVLIRDGHVDAKTMAKHGIGQADLDEGLRMERSTTPPTSSGATLEAGGKISVVPRT